MARRCVHAAFARWPRRRHWIERLAKPNLNLVRPKKSVERHLWIAFVESRPRRLGFFFQNLPPCRARHPRFFSGSIFWFIFFGRGGEKKIFVRPQTSQFHAESVVRKSMPQIFLTSKKTFPAKLPKQKIFSALGKDKTFSWQTHRPLIFAGVKSRRPFFSTSLWKKNDKRIFFPFQGRSFYFINSQFCNWKALVPIKYRNCSFFSVC